MKFTAAGFDAVICGRRMIGEAPGGNNAAIGPENPG